MNILCIIPARSGSKGLPDKNIKMFKGKPLLAWSIEQAKQSMYSTQMKIIVSTDSEKYANIAREYGAEVPFLRPSEISGDLSTDFEFIDHAVKWLKTNKEYHSDIVIQLRPTSPMRKVKTIDVCLALFIHNFETYDSLRTVVPIDKSPFKMYCVQDNALSPLFSKIYDINEPYNQCRQILPQCYLHNGYIDILKTSILDRGTISGDLICPYIMNNNDTIDIDTLDDWFKAEK